MSSTVWADWMRGLEPDISVGGSAPNFDHDSFWPWFEDLYILQLYDTLNPKTLKP